MEAAYPGDGRFAASASAAQPVVPALLPTTTELQAVPSNPTARQQVTLTATVTLNGDPQNHNLVGRTVTFRDENKQIVLGNRPISAVQNAYQAVLPIQAAILDPSQPNIISATLDDNDYFATSVGTTTVTVSGSLLKE